MHVLDFDCRIAYASGFTLTAAFQLHHLVTLLTGPSGSGKTSILEAIAGLRSPATGCITLKDTVLFDSTAGINRPPAQRRVGMVFQDLLLFPHLTVQNNLRYPLKRRSTPDSAKLFDQAVSTLGLGDLLHRYPGRLSGGERQRVALGRALLSNPQLLLLDEPLTGLDLALRETTVRYIETAIHTWQIPTVIVSHTDTELHSLANAHLHIEQGTLRN